MIGGNWHEEVRERLSQLVAPECLEAAVAFAIADGLPIRGVRLAARRFGPHGWYDKHGILIADTVEDLHRVARRLKIPPKYFHHAKKRFPHYDIPPNVMKLIANYPGVELVDGQFIIEKVFK